MNKRPLLLLVDDEAPVLQALRRIFRNEPYDLRTAESAPAALEFFNSGTPVRAVISDYRMPVMNGVEFLREVYRRSPETVRIILSGFADRPVLLAAVQEGRIYKYLPKPWDDDLLRSTVRKGIEQSAPLWERREQIQTLLAENTLLQSRIGDSAAGVANRTEFVERMIRLMNTPRNVADNRGAGILCVGSDGVILICNEEAAAGLGTPPHHLVGRAAHEVLSAGLNGFVRELLSSETAGSLSYQEGGLTMRGMRLAYDDNDYSALIFI